MTPEGKQIDHWDKQIDGEHRLESPEIDYPGVLAYRNLVCFKKYIEVCRGKYRLFIFGHLIIHMGKIILDHYLISIYK